MDLALRLMNTSRGSSRSRNAAEHQARRQHGRHVLGGMHREVDRAGRERLLDLLGEQTLAAGIRQRPILDAVAAGADRPGCRSARASKPCAAASACRTMCACASASGLPRVPSRRMAPEDCAIRPRNAVWRDLSARQSRSVG